MTWAEDQQTVSSVLDDRLLDQARRRHPTVAWWWGSRRDGSTAVALCYVCDSAMGTYNSLWPVTDTVIRAVMAHRDSHRPGRIVPAPAASPEGTS